MGEIINELNYENPREFYIAQILYRILFPFLYVTELKYLCKLTIFNLQIIGKNMKRLIWKLYLEF